MGDIYETFIRSIETKYNAVYPDGDRKDLKKHLFKRYKPERAVLERLMEAIVEYCPKAYGLPDVARVRTAADKYEADYDAIDESMQPGLREYVPVPPTEDELKGMEQIRAMAQASGVDTTKDGWFTAYVMRELKARHPEKAGIR